MKKYKNEYITYDNYSILQIIGNNKNIKVLIDTEDINKLKLHSWRINDKGYIISDINRKKVRIHNFILNRDTSNPKIVCDHVNRNKLDNRKCNLRIVSQKENNKNRISKKGKYYTKKKNKWFAYYLVNRRMHSLGYHNTEEEARNAVERHFCENQ